MKKENRLGLSLFILAGLLVAGCQDKILLQDKSPFSANVVRLGDTVVADVDGTKLYVSDIEHGALAKGLIKPGGRLTPTDPIFQSILDELIDQRLLALEALRRSLDQNDTTRRRLAIARERILSNVVIETLLAEKVTDTTIQRMFDEQAAMQEKSKQTRARYLLVDSEEKAKELKKLAEDGGDFSALAREFSIDTSTRDLGGDLHYFSKGSLSKALEALAFSSEIGSITDPVETDEGWYILKIEGRRQAPQPEFAEIKSEIVNYMTYDEIEKLLKSLRASSNITLTLSGTKPPVTTAPSPLETQKNDP